MPSFKQKKTVLGALKTACMAPVMICFLAVLLGLYIVPAVIIISLFTWLINVPAPDLTPPPEILILVICLTTIAAALLAIRDYCRGDGYVTVWKPDPQCEEVTRRYAEMLVGCQFKSLYEHFAVSLAAALSYEEFIPKLCLPEHWEHASPKSVVLCAEVPAPLASDSQVPLADSVAYIIIETDKIRFDFRLWLDSKKDYKIVSFSRCDLD